MSVGKVFLVGAGPGDPGLLTCKGRAILERCEVVVYDRLANPCLLDLAPAEAERISVGKGPGTHAMTQEGSNACLVEQGLAGKQVCGSRAVTVRFGRVAKKRWRASRSVCLGRSCRA